MCPVCIATAAVLAGSVTGTGGLTAFIARKFLKKSGNAPEPIAKKERDNGNHDNKRPESEGGLAR